MGKYNLTVPDGTNDFQFGTDTYSANSSYETDDPCEAISFYNAARTSNPDMGRQDGSNNFWSNVDNACNAQIAANPVPAPATVPVDVNPTDGDNPTDQGAPEPPPSGTVDGVDGAIVNPNPPPSEEPTRPPDGEPHPTNGGEEPHEHTDAGDPVDLFQGAFYLQETDLSIPNTVLPLAFTRYYRSGAASYGPFGWNWDHNFNLFIRELNSGDIALWRNLHEHIYKFDGVNYEPPRGVFEKLEKVVAIAQVYEIKTKGGMTMRFERPAGWIDGERIPLLWLKDQHGNGLRFSYGAEDKLAEVRDDDDRFFKFDYDQCGLLVAVSDHNGRKFDYLHDEQTMQLTCVKSPAIADFPDGINRNYYYEHPWTLPELRHNIVRVADAEGNKYLENKYDQDPASWSYARVTEQLYGGFLYQFRYTQLQWVPANALFANIPAVRAEVMNPDFGLETYTFNYRGDLLDRRYRLSKDKSYRVVAWQYEFDEQGNLSKTTSPHGGDEINVYDFANADPRMRNNLLKKEITAASGFPSPSRIIWRGKYDTVYQQIVEEKNEKNEAVTYKYDFDLTPAAPNNTGKLMEVIQPDCTLPDGTIQQAKTTFEYNAKGQLTATILADGTRNENQYGAAGESKNRLIKQLFDVGNLNIEIQTKYDIFGFNSEKINANGHSAKQIFNALGLPEKSIALAVNGVSAETIFHYDSDKNVSSTEKPKGTFTDAVLVDNFIEDNYERDVLGRPVKYILSSNTGESLILTICNDYRGFPVETTNPDASKIRSKFDERGLPLMEEVIGTDDKKISSKKVYDRSGKIAQETNAFGLITKYKYDGFSRVSKVILPNGTEIKNKWLANNLLESEQIIGDDGNGAIRELSFKSYAYDEKDRKIRETLKSFTNDPAISTNIITTFVYDQLDRLVQIKDNRTGIFTNQYDGLGRVVVETDPEGNEERYTYDNNGNVIQIESHHIEPNGTVSIIKKEFKFDERDRRIEMIEPDGAKVTSVYDDRNLLVKQTDLLGVVREILFNSFNNKIQEKEDVGGLNIQRSWLVDNMSRVTAFTDPTGQVSTYSFDSVGRNSKIDYPNGFSTIKTFNDSNQIIKEHLASGGEFEYTYDTANRISKIVNSAFPAPLKKVEPHEFTYDGLDRIMSAKTGTNITSRTYDSQSRLTSELTLGNTINCRYNDATGEVEKKWPDGRTEKLSHDLNGILTKIEESVGGTLGTGNMQIASFIKSGPTALGETSYQGGLTLVNSYDERKRLTEISVQSPAGVNENIKYRYNKANSKQVEAVVGQNPKISYLEYDNSYRLLKAKDNFVTPIASATTQAQHESVINTIKVAAAAALHQEQFIYNAADARTKYTETGSTDKNYTFSGGHKIQNDGTNAYTYHANGAIDSDGLFDFEIDALGRIMSVKSGAILMAEFSYDAFGRPSSIKEYGRPDKSFNYLGGFVEQENENGVPSRHITIHPVSGVPIAYHTAGNTHYTLFDSRFNLTGLLDTNGNLLETYRYKSFGVPQVYDSTGAAIGASSLGVEPIFGGQSYLSTTGFYLSKRRLMNPVNGVFLSGDSSGYQDSSSLYVYAAQDPINNIDPNGDIIPFIVAAFVIGGALAGAGYSAYDAYHNPNKYEGWQGSLRVLGNVFGGAAIGGIAIVGGELVLAAGGTGIFATGTSLTATSLTATQTFVLYGSAAATTGAIGRGGFNNMFPEYVDPVSAGTIATDFAIGGTLPVLAPVLKNAAAPIVRPIINGGREMFTRAVGGNWRAFGTTAKLIWKGYSRNSRLEYGISRLFWNNRTFSSVSNQYWSQTIGRANGKALHHIFVQNQSSWMPQGFRNAAFNMLEIPASLNTWMGGRLWREMAFRGGVVSLLTATGLGSYGATSGLLDASGDATEPDLSNGDEPLQPNETRPTVK